MSGKLVGEVISAVDQLRSRGVTERGFMALIAIAEKCHHETRQGSVRWDHICDGLYGASKRTAERAVRELRSAGVLSVVKPGFNNNHGRACAPIYAVSALTDTDTHLSGSPMTDTDTQVSASPVTDTDKTETDTDKTGGRYRHPGVVLDGSLDGPIDGTTKRGARKRATPLPANWAPDADTVSRMAAKYPRLNIAEEIEAFTDKSAAKGWTNVDHTAAFKHWLRNAEKYRRRDQADAPATTRHTATYATNDDKVRGWLQLATNDETPALPATFIEGEIA